MDIEWKNQHCGVHQAEAKEMFELMPDIKRMILGTFPDRIIDFVWDVKVHMLMPGQYPGIPNWHFDNVPRVNNKQDFELIKPEAPMYLWVSGHPLTEFRNESKQWFIKSKQWVRFTQKDEHRVSVSNDFTWRGFIRATHKSIAPQRPRVKDSLRRHSQVYLDSGNFTC